MRESHATENLQSFSKMFCYAFKISHCILYYILREGFVYFFAPCRIMILKRGAAVKKALNEEERERLEKRFAEDVWLNYLNRYLFESGTISDKEYKKMTEKIATRREQLSRGRSAM